MPPGHPARRAFSMVQWPKGSFIMVWDAMRPILTRDYKEMFPRAQAYGPGNVDWTVWGIKGRDVR